jgi:broad specificity phosphatase PhoE
MIQLLESNSPIIGKTKSGKVVYQSFLRQQDYGSIANWSAADFWEAEDMHRDAAAVAAGEARDSVSYDKSYTPPPERASSHKHSADSFAKLAKRTVDAVDRIQGKSRK